MTQRIRYQQAEHAVEIITDLDPQSLELYLHSQGITDYTVSDCDPVQPSDSLVVELTGPRL